MYLETNIFHCHFFHHAFHMNCLTIEPVSSWSEGDCQLVFECDSKVIILVKQEGLAPAFLHMFQAIS